MIKDRIRKKNANMRQTERGKDMYKKMISAVLIGSMIAAMPVQASEIEENTIYRDAEDTVELTTATSAENASKNDAEACGTGYIPMSWDNNVNMTDKDITLAEINAIADSETASVSSKDFSKAVDIPSAYPAGYDKKNDIESYLSQFPSIRSQGDLGTCWAHSVMSGSEFSQIKNGEKDNTLDYSEMYLAYGAYSDVENPVVGDSDEGRVETYTNDYDRLKNGGNMHHAAQFLSKGYGFIPEEKMPYMKGNSGKYDTNGNLLHAGILTHELYKEDTAHLENEYMVDIHSDNGVNLIKEAVMENGAVAISFSISGENEGYSREYNSFYNNSRTVSDHAVAIVGWDDAFPATSFIKEAPQNGAWLIRNSWGGYNKDTFGLGSYFWLSYADTSIANAAYIFDLTKDADNYDNNYFYDTQIHENAMREAGTFANVFTVQDKCNEELTEVGVEVGAPTSYVVEIYTDLGSDSNPVSGIRQLESRTEGSFALPGIYTVKLTKPVVMEKGSRFSVIVKTDSKGLIQERGCDFTKGKICCGIRRGQSFVMEGNGSWTDIVNKANTPGSGNVCISAHTKYTEEVPEDGDVKIAMAVKDEFGKDRIIFYSKKYHIYEDSDGTEILNFPSSKDNFDMPLYQYTGKKIKPGKNEVLYDNILYYRKKGNFKIKYKKGETRNFKSASKDGSGKAYAEIEWDNKKGYNLSFRIIAYKIIPREITQKDYDEGTVSIRTKKGKIKSIRLNIGKKKTKIKAKDCKVFTDENGTGIRISGKNIAGEFYTEKHTVASANDAGSR